MVKSLASASRPCKTLTIHPWSFSLPLALLRPCQQLILSFHHYLRVFEDFSGFSTITGKGNSFSSSTASHIASAPVISVRFLMTFADNWKLFPAAPFSIIWHVSLIDPTSLDHTDLSLLSENLWYWRFFIGRFRSTKEVLRKFKLQSTADVRQNGRLEYKIGYSLAHLFETCFDGILILYSVLVFLKMLVQ